MRFTFGSLFAGIGGFDLGLERVGMEVCWQVEIDPFCQRVLAKHWPDVRRYGDVRECGSHNLDAVDLIVGGFPCQPHSVAGKRKGAADDRNLWPEFLRIAREVRPTWVLGENVPGIVSLYLDTVLADLEGEGYTCWTFNIPACAFNAPHRRERVFIVAHADRRRQQGASVPIRPGGSHETTGNAGGRCTDVSHANGKGLQGHGFSGTTGNGEQDVADSMRSGWYWDLAWQIYADESGEQAQPKLADSDWWAVEPDVGRVANGVPHRVERIRALGNAVVPQVAEWLGRCILEAHYDNSASR